MLESPSVCSSWMVLIIMVPNLDAIEDSDVLSISM